MAAEAGAHHHVRQALPELRSHGLRQHGPQAAAAAGARPLQAEGGSTAVGIAARHHQQTATGVLACGGRRDRPGDAALIIRLQQQRLPAGQRRQQARRQAQIDALQLSHPGQRVVLHQALFDQADAAGEGCTGTAVAQGAAAVGAEAAGHIDGDQAVGTLPAAGLQQSADRLLQRAALADAEQGIKPHGRIRWIRRLLQGRNVEPARMAPVGGGEGFMALERAPDPHGDARQLQLTCHHQSVATVVAWPHQHQGAPLPQLPPPRGATQFGRDGQGSLLHQGLHRQPAGEQLLLQRRHLGGTHQ